MKLYSIMTDNWDLCFICGKPAEQIHHVMNKADRKKSEKYGLLIPVCSKCHARIHDTDETLNKEIKKIAQADFMMSHTLGDWLRIFGKSFL